MNPETPDPELEARLADALAAARTDSRLRVQAWPDAPRRIVRASRRRRARRAAITMTSVATLVLGAIGGTYLYVGHQLHTLQTTSLASIPGVKPVKGRGHLAAKPKTGQPFTMLILGTDSREGTGTKYGTDADACHCSDTIILARVDPQTSKVSLMSVPRDIPITNDRGNRAKLNSAFATGPDGSVAAIEKTLNVPINHWVVLDLAGFSSIVNAIDGLRLDVPYPIRDKNAGLSLTTTGCQTVTGDQALAISRARELQYYQDGAWHYDNTWEYGRQRREQILLRVMAAHTVKKSLTNPLTASKVISTLTSGHRLAIDNQVSTSELLDLAADFAGFDAGAMKTFNLPTVTTRIDTQDYEVLQPDDDAATIQAWYDAVLPDVKPSAATSSPQPATTTEAAAPTTSGAAAVAPVVAPPPAAAATTTAAVAPNEPKPWDPVPCTS